MPNQVLSIINKRGLHARAATKLAKLASLFNCEVQIRILEGTWVDAKSVMNLMLMAASIGTQIEVRTQGPDAETALKEITALIEDYFGEGE